MPSRVRSEMSRASKCAIAPEDVEYELAGGRGGVEALLEADQVDAAGLELVDRLEQLAQRSPQTVEASNAQAISGPGMVDELGESGAVKTPSGDDVGEYPGRAGLDEARVLGLWVLVVGGHPGVAQRVAGTGGDGRTISSLSGRCRGPCRGCRSAGLNRLFNGPLIVDGPEIAYTPVRGTQECSQVRLDAVRNLAHETRPVAIEWRPGNPLRFTHRSA